MIHNTAPTTPSRKQTREPSGRAWPIIIVSLLLLNVTICAITVTLSLRNPARVTPSYYEKSLNWDAERAAALIEQEPTPATQAETND
jgi:hypothetical protein